MSTPLPTAIRDQQQQIIRLLQEKDAINERLAAARSRQDSEQANQIGKALRGLQDSITSARSRLKGELAVEALEIRLSALQEFHRLALTAASKIETKAAELQAKQQQARESAGELRTAIASLEAARDSATALADVKDLASQIRESAGNLEAIEQFDRNLTRQIETATTAAADWQKLIEEATRGIWQAEFDRRCAELTATGWSLAGAWVAFRKAGLSGLNSASYEKFLATVTGPAPDGDLIVGITKDLETALGLTAKA